MSPTRHRWPPRWPDIDVVLNATNMRHNVPVNDAAIAAGVRLVDLGSHYPETLQQLDRHSVAESAGCRIVPGCGVAPGLTNILARHPIWTSPGIVVTRFDALSPRRVTAAYVGSRGITSDDRSANVKGDPGLRLRRRAVWPLRLVPIRSLAVGRPACIRPKERSTRARSSTR